MNIYKYLWIYQNPHTSRLTDIYIDMDELVYHIYPTNKPMYCIIHNHRYQLSSM